MCRAMNRSFISVIAGGFGADATSGGEAKEQRPYKQGSAEDAAFMSQIGGSPGGTATNSTSKDRGHKLLMLWLIQQTNTRITAMGERLEYHNNDTVVGANNRYKRNAFYGVLEQRFGGGKHSVFIAGGRALSGSCEKQGGVACTTQNLGADYWNAGYIYRFSRRTEGFIAYYHLKNQESAQYSIGPFVNTVNIAPGADITGYGAGLQHFF